MNLETVNDWEGFYQKFKFTELGKDLAVLLPKNILQQVLSPVLTVAQSIDQWGLIAPDQKDITILWAGAELPEMMDGGRWFGLLPYFLDRDLGVTLCFMNSKVKPLQSPNPRAIDTLPQIEIQHLTGDGHPTPDLVVWSHPDNVSKWRSEFPLSEPGDTPVLALYWSALDAAMEREWFKLQGFSVQHMHRNGFELANKVDTTATWGRFVDALMPEDPTETGLPREELQNLGMIRHHSGLLGFGHPSGQPGRLRKSFKVRAMQQDDEYLYVLDDLFLNRANRTLYRFDEDARQLYPVCEVAQHLIEPVPKSNADILEAYRWAARIKLSYAMIPPEKEQDAREYLLWLRQMAEGGDANAMNSYAQWVEAGFMGEPDTQAAGEMFRLAADAGHASAQYTFADIAFHELKDTETATRYFDLAAKQGHNMAAFNMALLHIENMIPGADIATGMMYLQQAADGNEVNAQVYLGEVLKAQGRNSEAFEYLCRAADRGSLEAAGKALDLAPELLAGRPVKEQRKLKKKLTDYRRLIRQPG